MLYRLPLKNSDKSVLVDGQVYETINTHSYLLEIGFLKNLRIHSSGYAFFQKNYPQKDGKYKNVTIYLHRWIAENFVEQPKTEKKLLVSFKNGDRLDCRLENIVWKQPSILVRETQKNANKSTGYRGVSKANQKYRAVIFVYGKRIDLGNFDTPEEAAKAYNEKSIEFFGITPSLNIIKEEEDVNKKQSSKKRNQSSRKE